MCTVIFFQTSRLRSKFSLIGKKKRRCTLKIISKFDILTKTLIAKNIGSLINDFSFNPITKSCFPINAFRGLYTNRGNLYRDEFFYERNIEDEPFCPWSFYRVICVYVQPPLAFVIGKVWEIERFQIARARVLQWRASSESHVRSSELHRRPRYTRIHLRGATFIFCYRELYLDGGRVARLKNSR